MKKIIKLLTPPILINIFNKIRNKKYGWKGDFRTWQDARDASTGYDTDDILLSVKKSLLKVKNGEAIYERDSVIFDEIQYSWPLLSGILFSSINSGNISVLDFGGSLGSTYFQNKKFLDLIEDVSWCVVEQNNFVKVGREEFEDDRLKFFYSVDECLGMVHPNTLLLSSVMQYIEKPYEVLTDILKYNFEYIVIDRTLFNVDDVEQIKLQIVPPNIYEASYPCWFFSQSGFINFLVSKGYILIDKFDSNDLESADCKIMGFFFKKND